MKCLLAHAVLAAGAVAPLRAFAISTITPTDLSGFTDSMVSTLVQTVGIAADHHAYMPASSMGMLLGFDVGVDSTYVAFPAAFAAALAQASGQSSSQVPSGLLLPKLNAHKGLPFGIDVGASFMVLYDSGQSVFTTYGGELKWTFVRGLALPSVAVRGSYTSNSLYFLNTNTTTVDLVVSKSLILLEPYVGGGMQFWSGSLSVPSSVPQASGLSLSASGSNPHFYGGAMLKLALLRLDIEADYSTMNLATLGGKVSIGF